jgi:preprotein translocase subunit SecY
MWLGEQITQRGIGQGSSLIIFAGIVAGFPSVVANLWGNFQAGDLRGSQLLTIAVLVVASTVFVVFVERAQRRIPIHHAKRVVGRKVYGASMQFLPFKVNAAGVIPPIFASALITFPSMMSQMFKSDNRWLNEVSAWLAPGGTFYDALYVGLIVFFSYFTTSIFINSNDVAENLKEHGGFVPGIRPGKHTADYLDHVLTRLTTLGAVYLSFICVAPFFFFDSFQVFLGGTAVLIIVGVAINFAEQIQTYLMTQQYDRFLGDEGASGNRRFKGRGPE